MGLEPIHHQNPEVSGLPGSLRGGFNLLCAAIAKQ